MTARALIAIAITAATGVFLLFGCKTPSPFVHASGDELRRGWRSFPVRGAAVIDDSTLWDPQRVVPKDIEERDWAFAATGGMSMARLVLKMDYFIDEAGAPRPEGFAWLDRELSIAEKFNLPVLLDMHIPPGGAIEDFRPTKANALFWASDSLKERFVSGWKLIASRYRHDRRVMGYEVMNEPSGDPDAYWELLGRAVRAIRGADGGHLIVVQPAMDDLLRPVDDPNFAYSVHFYAPLSFTHQNIAGEKLFASSGRVLYPGVAFDEPKKPSFFGEETLARILGRKIKRPAGVKAPVILGEYGVSTSADEASAGRWIRDVQRISEEKNLAGTIFWRQTDPTPLDLSLGKNSTMAVINADGSYYSPARFFGIRPELAKKNPNFDAVSFYLNYGHR